MHKWKPIDTSPKYPLDINNNGPHFIGLTSDTDYGAVECWWSYPAVGCTAYVENHPPSLKMHDDMGCTVRATHWIPLPEEPTEVEKG